MQQGAEGLAGELDLAGQGIAASLADGVIVMDPGGEVVWANDAFAVLLGYEVADLVGTNGFRLVHPDEVERATDGFAYAASFPTQPVVSAYRVAHRDGRWVDVEIKSAWVPRSEGDLLAVVVRDGRARSAVVRALRSVALGGPFRSTADLTCRAVRERWHHAGAAVVTTTDAGAEVFGSGLTPPLADASATLAASAGDEVGVFAIPGFDPAVAEAARDQGFEGCVVAPVAAPSGARCALVVWFDRLVIARLEFRHAAAELTEVLSLSLEREHHLRQLRYVARHDALTDLLNRVGFFEELGQLAESTRAAGRRTIGLLYVDLDELKQVNDRMGHAEGDELLVRTAKRLHAVAPPGSLVGRLGGDEFAMAVPLASPTAPEQLVACADAVLAEMATPPGISVSIGLTLDEPPSSVASAIERADAAMYRAKAAGPGVWSH